MACSNTDYEAEEFDELAQSIPDSLLDSRSYYWPNFNQPRYIHHHQNNFAYNIQLHHHQYLSEGRIM